MILLACDCGLANFGWCVLRVGPAVECLDAGVIRTEKSDAKRNVLASDDNTRRVRELAHALEAIIVRYKPTVLCTEGMSFPRSSSCAAKLGMSRAVLDTLAEVRGLPVLQASPQQVKKHVTGTASASKDLVGAHVLGELPSLEANVPSQKTLREHVYDAAAVGLTCLSSDVVRALRGAA